MEVKAIKQLTIIGCGPGAVEYMTEAGRKGITQADVAAGSVHLLKLYATEGKTRLPIASDIEGALEAIDIYLKEGKRVAVLVSGDPGLCSLATPVIQRFGRDACDVIPGISSIQLLFARLGLDWMDARIFSAHKNLPEVDAKELKSIKTLVILCGHHVSQQWVIELYLSLGQGHKLIVCQDLSLPTERIDEVNGEMFSKMELSSRTIVVIKSS
ncbi:MAG: precorrin-6y C5,15-methyltransferase (decarboxylating) subunit CbiE [bacterium]